MLLDYLKFVIKTLLFFAAIASVVFSSIGEAIKTYFITNNILTFSEEGITIPMLFSIQSYILIGSIIIFVGAIWASWKASRFGFSDELQYFLVWLTAISSCFYSLSKTISWLELTFWIVLAGFLFWSLGKYLVWNIKENLSHFD
ncbi:MAG: hypothetical protein RLN88_08455 [Ekhidna sp.]|uniref:hypothetical protein n=1 Tax=Ekhidna sp. TaxID=2608089 RepID=UPI0032EC81A3